MFAQSSSQFSILAIFQSPIRFTSFTKYSANNSAQSRTARYVKHEEYTEVSQLSVSITVTLSILYLDVSYNFLELYEPRNHVQDYVVS